jgi:RND family efflux transporter MFP subunit
MEPREVVQLGSPVGGVVAEMTVDRGDIVRRGQLLARLNDSAERAALDLANARAEFGQRRVTRNEDLYADDLISIHERDEMETEARIAELEVQQANAMLELRSLISPVDGVVVARHVSEGEYVSDGQVLTLAQVDPISVEVVVPVAQFGSISTGMVGTVRPEAPVGGSYEARVTVVDAVVDAASGTFGVRLELPNTDGRLPTGLRCEVSFAD